MASTKQGTPIHPDTKPHSAPTAAKNPRTFTSCPVPPIFRLNADLGTFDMMCRACRRYSPDPDPHSTQNMIEKCLLAINVITRHKSALINNIEERRRLLESIGTSDIQDAIEHTDDTIANYARYKELEDEWQNLVDRSLVLRVSYQDDLLAAETSLMDVRWQRTILQKDEDFSRSGSRSASRSSR